MWLPQRREFLILLIVAMLQAELQATGIRQKESQSSSNGLGNSAHKNAGAPNDYGPPIKITSSILQLTKTSEGSTNIADLQHHEATIDSSWKSSGALEHSDWLVAGTGAHAVPVALEVNVADGGGGYIPWPEQHQQQQQPHGIASSVFSHDDGLGLSHGLHTQITSSGGVGDGSLAISDNLDFDGVAERRLNQHHSTSYGK